LATKPRSAIQISLRLALDMSLIFIIHGEEGFRSTNHRLMFLDPLQQFTVICWWKFFDGSLDFDYCAHDLP
jgi:hypothetical protein